MEDLEKRPSLAERMSALKEGAKHRPVRELDEEFSISTGPMRGHHFKFVRTYDWWGYPGYMYEVKKYYPDTGKWGNTYYEIFFRRVSRFSNAVMYPSQEAFGEWAWCCRNLKDVDLKINGKIKDIIENRQKRKKHEKSN